MSSRKKTAPLFPGKYSLPGDRTPAQREFFFAIQRKAPEVLESLRDKILPSFKISTHDYRPQKGRSSLDNPAPRKKGLADFYLVVWAWAKEHHLVTGNSVLSEPRSRKVSDRDIESQSKLSNESPEKTFFFSWAWLAILGTLYAWSDDPEKCRKLELELPHWPYPIGEGWGLMSVLKGTEGFTINDLFVPPFKTIEHLPFRFQCPGWNPLQEKRDEARQRILKQLECDLDLRMDQAENLVKLFDFTVAPAKVSTDHFDWLVQFQIQEKTFYRISKDDPAEPDPQTVSDGVKSAAYLVIGPAWETWLRQPRPGRPKGS